MPDGLTAEERALIASYPKSRVTRVPRGATGLGEIRWDPRKNALRYVDPETVTARRRTSGARQRAVSPEVRCRRERVGGLARQGRTVAQIMAELDLSEYVVRGDLARLGISAARAEPGPRLSRTAAERRALVRAAFQPQLTVFEIARATGLTLESVRGHLRALGLTPRAGKAGPRARPEILARRAALPGLVAQGLSAREIAAQLGVSRDIVYNDCLLLGLCICKRGGGSG